MSVIKAETPNALGLLLEQLNEMTHGREYTTAKSHMNELKTQEEAQKLQYNVSLEGKGNGVGVMDIVQVQHAFDCDGPY